MLQVGSTIRIKQDAFKYSDDPTDFEARGKIGTIVFELSDGWEVEVDGEFYVLDDAEFDEVEIEENIDPDTPRNREVLAAIRRGIELLGWEEFEKTLVEALGLYLVAEGDGKRCYEHPNGQTKFTFSQRGGD